MRQIILLLFSWMLCFPLIAENTSNTYKITKEWKADAGIEFELEANNQNFSVEVWDKDIVRIDFILTSVSGKIDKDDFEEGLKIDADKSGNKLSIKTNVNDLNSGSVWNWIFNSKNDKKDYRTNSILYLPRNLSGLNFKMNYSELKIGEINAPLKISSNYGILFVEKNKNRTILNLSYSEVTLGNLSHAKITTSYTDLISTSIDTLFITSSYDDVQISNCGIIPSLKVNYGNIKIEKAAYVKASCTYSDLKISALSEGIDAGLTYSDLKLPEIGKNISGITVTGTYSDCQFKVNPDYPVNLAIRSINGDINLKNTSLLITQKKETATTTQLSAKTKSATESSPTIKVETKNSDIIIN